MRTYFQLRAEGMTTRALHSNVRVFGRDNVSLQMQTIVAELDKRTRNGIDCGCGWGDYCDNKDGCECLASADAERFKTRT